MHLDFVDTLKCFQFYIFLKIDIEIQTASIGFSCLQRFLLDRFPLFLLGILTLHSL